MRLVLPVLVSLLPWLWAQDLRYLEGEDFLGGMVPAWAPHNSGTYDRGTLPGTSRGRVATLGEVPQLGVIAYHLGDGSLPPGEYHLWLRLRAGDNDRSVAVAFGPFGAGEKGPLPVGQVPDPGDDGGFHWRQAATDGKPAVLAFASGKDHALVLSRAGNDTPYIDAIAFAPAAAQAVPPEAVPPGGYEPRFRPRIVAAQPPPEPPVDPDLARFRTPPLPPPPGEASLALHLASTGAIYFPLLTEGQCRLSMDLRVTAGEGLALAPEQDTLRLHFRELFSARTSQADARLPAAVPAGTTQALSLEWGDAGQPELAPGAYLVTADLVRSGASLCGGRVGAAELYVRRADESRGHALLCFMVAHAGFNEDRLYGGHFVGMLPLVPATYDPLDNGTWHEWLKLYSRDTGKFLELLHDGGFGFLHAAKVLRALGETERAEFADRIVAGDALYVLEKMVQPDGKVHACHDELEEKWPDLKAGHATRTDDILQNEGFVLKLAAQCYFHFRDLPGHEQTASRLMGRGAVLARHVCDPAWIPCQGCTVYDGRTISGQAWWVLAVADHAGQVPQAEAETVVRNCAAAATQTLLRQGWYDYGCLQEGGCHVGYGAQNLINALQPGYRVADLLGRNEEMGRIRRALEMLYTFLAEANAVLTGQPMWYPPRHSSWSNGHMYVLCSEYLRDFRDDARVRAYRSLLGAIFFSDLSGTDGGIGKWHGHNYLATLAYSCPEYLAWEKRNGPSLY
jgi:hypothetical protein